MDLKRIDIILSCTVLLKDNICHLLCTVTMAIREKDKAHCLFSNTVVNCIIIWLLVKLFFICFSSSCFCICFETYIWLWISGQIHRVKEGQDHALGHDHTAKLGGIINNYLLSFCAEYILNFFTLQFIKILNIDKRYLKLHVFDLYIQFR